MLNFTRNLKLMRSTLQKGFSQRVMRIDKYSESNIENKHTNEVCNEKILNLLKNSMQYENKMSWEITEESMRARKYPTRQRIEMILDNDSFFVELSQTAGYELYPGGKLC